MGRGTSTTVPLMPGGREITGRDVHAALRSFGGERGDPAALRACIAPDAAFAHYEDLVAACPPERIVSTRVSCWPSSTPFLRRAARA